VYIADIVESATHQDWTAISQRLIADAREALLEETEVAAR